MKCEDGQSETGLFWTNLARNMPQLVTNWTLLDRFLTPFGALQKWHLHQLPLA
jgi:hypothetical protein